MLDENQKAAPVDAEEPESIRDEDGVLRSGLVERIAAALEAGDADTVRALVGDWHESDVGALIDALDPSLRPKLVELLGEQFHFKALTQVDQAVRQEIIDALDPAAVAAGVTDLESDDAVNILEGLPDEKQKDILERLPHAERVALARSLQYPEDSAGRRMQTEYIAVRPDATVGQTIDYLRETTDLPERFYEIFLTDPQHHLLGAVALDRLLRAKRPVSMSELMDEELHHLLATDDQEEVARVFERYDLLSAPVVDEADRLVGVITIDDVVDVIEEEAEEDIKALGGVRNEQLSDPVWTVARRRFAWLLVNLATAFLASSVLGLFEGSLQKMVALAVLAPIVASQGGNAASQTMTVAVRALAVQELSRANAWRIILREALVGLVNGVAFAVITGVAAYAWFRVPDLGLVIGLAMVCNLIAAALGGILIPLVLERSGADPAVSSGVFVTTVTDVVGFFSFLGIATLWFGLR
jgi:magnesium transporter